MFKSDSKKLYEKEFGNENDCMIKEKTNLEDSLGEIIKALHCCQVFLKGLCIKKLQTALNIDYPKFTAENRR